jgi:hypothetical protein
MDPTDSTKEYPPQKGLTYSIRANNVASFKSDSHHQRDEKVVGMTCALTGTSTNDTHGQETVEEETVEEAEKKVRDSVAVNPFFLGITGNYASIKVFVRYLIIVDTILSCTATVLLTLFWYYQKVSEQPSYCKIAILRSH